jgi:hypothetical protein
LTAICAVLPWQRSALLLQYFLEQFEIGLKSIKAVLAVQRQKSKKLMALAGFEKDKDYWAVYVGSQNAKGNVLQLLNGRRAIIQVSSINHRKAHHIVFWDGHKLHDPSTKQVYRWLEQLTSAEHIWIFNEVPNANA